VLNCFRSWRGIIYTKRDLNQHGFTMDSTKGTGAHQCHEYTVGMVPWLTLYMDTCGNTNSAPIRELLHSARAHWSGQNTEYMYMHPHTTRSPKKKNTPHTMNAGGPNTHSGVHGPPPRTIPVHAWLLLSETTN